MLLRGAASEIIATGPLLGSDDDRTGVGRVVHIEKATGDASSSTFAAASETADGRGECVDDGGASNSEIDIGNRSSVYKTGCEGVGDVSASGNSSSDCTSRTASSDSDPSSGARIYRDMLSINKNLLSVIIKKESGESVGEDNASVLLDDYFPCPTPPVSIEEEDEEEANVTVSNGNSPVCSNTASTTVAANGKSTHLK